MGTPRVVMYAVEGCSYCSRARALLVEKGVAFEEIDVEAVPGAREVVLTVTVSAKIGDVTIFLVEIKQAGLFVIRNLGDGDLKRAISTVCPGILFPYARAAVSQLVSQGGFPQFLLPPVNFDALYAANQAQPPGQAN